MDHAIAHGDLVKVQRLRGAGAPWDEITCATAAMFGRFDLLQWSHANGCPWDTRTCSSAAAGGHLNILQWAHANGCPWDTETCLSAAVYGPLDTLRWARTHGCPWDKAHVSDPDILKWITSGAGDYPQRALTKSAAPRTCVNKSR